MRVLHVLVGPNGAGKSKLFERVIGPATHLPFVNADEIARRRWPGEEMTHAYEASRLAAEQRAALLSAGVSFATETVFSHPSKLALLEEAKAAGYRIHLHVVLVTVELAVARVRLRAAAGGHGVPEHKVRERFARLWRLVEEAAALADVVTCYDNSRAGKPFVVVARMVDGDVTLATLPRWSPFKPGSPKRRRRR